MALATSGIFLGIPKPGFSTFDLFIYITSGVFYYSLSVLC